MDKIFLHYLLLWETLVLQTSIKLFEKGVVSILLGGVGPLVYMGTSNSLFFALMLATSGLKIAFSNLDLISTSPFDSTKGLKPRIPNMGDVIVINNSNSDKIIMSEPVQKNQECWLPDQHFLNPNCEIKPAQIPDAIEAAMPNFKYEEAVNMNDVTGLDHIEFSDKYDMGPTKPKISNPCKSKGKEVNFLDKFGDSTTIGESEGWDTCENEFKAPQKRHLRTRNKK